MCEYYKDPDANAQQSIGGGGASGTISKELRMMGHSTPKTAKLGFAETNDVHKDPEDEVNEYLMRAIDARSIDMLRSEHCQPVLLSFRRADVEHKYIAEPDRMLAQYFYCSLLIVAGMLLMHWLVFPM